MTAHGRFAIAPTLALLAVAGCGGHEAGRPYPVSGRVTSRGSRWPRGR